MRSIVASLVLLLAATLSVAQTCVPAPYGITSWYPAEGDAHDIISGNNGGINGTVSFAAGKVGQAFQFHGNQNDGVNLGNVSAFNFTASSSFSIEAWVNVAALSVASGNDGLVIVSLNYSCTVATPAAEVLAIQAGTWKALFMVRDANGHQGTLLSPNPVPAGTWIHLVGVRNASCSPKRISLYMNGSLVASAPYNTAASLSNVGPIGPDYIGRRFSCNTNNPFNGLIDEVAIYNRALTSCEIAALYNADCAGKCSLNACASSVCECGSGNTHRTGRVRH
jgi:hypothetical protein